MTLRLAHITSLDRAINIIKERRYRPTYSSPLAADSGLNAHYKNDENDYLNLNYERTGVILVLEWEGPVTHKFNLPLPPNVLVDQTPFRVMVSQGTTKCLRAVDIEITDSAVVRGRTPPFYCWSDKSKLRWEEKFIRKFEKSIKKFLKDKPFITVLP